MISIPTNLRHAVLFCSALFCSVMLRDDVIRFRYGVVSVRGAEVYELADEEGNLLNDPATQKERVRYQTLDGRRFRPVHSLASHLRYLLKSLCITSRCRHGFFFLPSIGRRRECLLVTCVVIAVCSPEKDPIGL